MWTCIRLLWRHVQPNARFVHLQAAGTHAVELLQIEAAGATQLFVQHYDEVPPHPVVTSIQVHAVAAPPGTAHPNVTTI